ncbi:MAG: transcriptional activator NhaR [Acidobacteriota bacterium]|nr:transcriptional activator NhaR [Acidobacteriota bacterium]
MPVDFLNFQHLYYFWIVGREGGISHASEVLDISPSTISSQISQLEKALQVKLFRRVGRNIRLTDVGQIAFRYAGQIFGLGREMTHALKGWDTGGPFSLQVGIADAVPKLVATKLLEPALAVSPEIRLTCREGRPELLLAELALHRLDLILLDAPADPGSTIRAFSRLLQDCDIAIFGTPELLRKYSHGFPESLEGAPVLLPTPDSSIRKSFGRWLEVRGLQPRVVGEFEDSALMKAFGEIGTGLFPAPLLIADDLERQHGVKCLGSLEGTYARYYAVTVERQLEHPAVQAICDSAGEAEA